jgi:hypothetical protein
MRRLVHRRRKKALYALALTARGKQSPIPGTVQYQEQRQQQVEGEASEPSREIVASSTSFARKDPRSSHRRNAIRSGSTECSHP